MDKKKLQEFIAELQSMVSDEDKIPEIRNLSLKDNRKIDVGSDSATAMAADFPAFINSNNHYYETFDYPNNIAITVDLVMQSSVISFCDVPNNKTLIDLTIQHLYKGGTTNVGFGKGFYLNLGEKLAQEGSNIVLTDSMGKRYIARNNIISNMKYTTSAPDSVKNLYTFKQLLNYSGSDKTQLLPVKWIYNNTLAKGYNAAGNLVLVNDNNGNHYQLKYNSSNKVIEFQNLKNNFGTSVFTFSYNSSGNLNKVSISDGDFITYEYDSNQFLTKIVYSNGITLTLSYSSDKLNKIESSDGYYININNSGSSIKVSMESSVTGIPNGDVCQNPPDLKSNTVTFGDKKATVDGRSIYNFTSDGYLSSYFKISNLLVVEAEQYNFVRYSSNDVYSARQEVYKAKPELLKKSSLNNFVFEYGENSITYYNKMNQAVKKEVKNVPISNNTSCDYTTTYDYNSNNLCEKESTVFTIKLSSGNKTYTKVIEYAYNDHFNISKKISYVVQDVNSLGKNVEEYSYNAYGENIQTVTYNSLEPNKKFYDVRSYDSLGRLSSQKDQTGNNTTYYSYVNDTNLLSEISFGYDNFIKYSYNDRDQIKSISSGGNSNDTITNNIEFDQGKIVGLKGGYDDIGFSYNARHQLTEITLGANEWISFSHVTGLSNHTTMTNGKDEQFRIETVKVGEHKKFSYGGVVQLEEKYNTDGKLNYRKDAVTNKEYSYTFDEFGRATSVAVDNLITETYTYNDFGNISEIKLSGNVSQTVNYFYEDNSLRRLNKIKFSNDLIEDLSYDLQGRALAKEFTVGTNVFKESMQYTSTSTRETTLPLSVNFSVNSTSMGKRLYTYDERGNIKTIDCGDSGKIDYTYDNHNRLIREDNKPRNASYFYTYDNYGNVLSKEQSIYSEPTESFVQGIGTKSTFKYTNGKLLTANDGTAIRYDANGCPSIYRGLITSWTKGNQLKSFNGVLFEYDALGRRISKSVVTRTLRYTVEYFYDSQGRLIKSSDGMEYFYDNDGVIGFKYNGQYYVYQKDIQDNIIGILDNNGTKVVEYNYDAWGNVSGGGFKKNITQPTTIKDINPFRYKSYFYDTETGMYYLHSRYYDPAICRFISSDNVLKAKPNVVNGLNLFAYCGNNPVMNVDPNGTSFFSFISGKIFQFAVSTICYLGMALGAIFDSEIREDMNNINWNPFNANENLVMGANKVSFYKGVPVIVVSNMGGSMSLGAIFFDKSQGVDTLKHERGHNDQLMQMGLGNYLILIAIPSLWKNGDFTPWELSASILGDSGLTAGSTSEQRDAAMEYLELASTPILNIFNVFWYLFY